MRKQPTSRAVLGIVFLVSACCARVSEAGEPSPGEARQALGRAEALAKALGSDDPADARNAIQEAVRLLPTMESMASVMDYAALNVALIRAEFERKASSSKSAVATAFYEAELKIMRGREADFSDLRSKLSGAVAQLKDRVEKAKANPDVQALLNDDELLQRAKDALEKLKSFKLPSVDP